MPELTIAKSLNKAYRQISIDKQSFDTFKQQLGMLYKQIATIDTEEKLKGDLMDFLKQTFYGQNYKVSPNGRIDCAIHLGNSIDAPIGVIIEVKMPTNVSEMISKENLNRKALQELLLYYLRERIVKKNIQLKQLIVTNVHEFFIFDAKEFERVFYSNKKIVKQFTEFDEGSLPSDKTDFFYKEIAAEAIESVKDSLSYTWFDIRKYKTFLNSDTDTDKRLIELYKVFSPEHLLKRRFQNDSNSLNTKFYSELLYIIGLEEVEDKESHKRIIMRKNAGNRNPASILENTITILDSEDCLGDIDITSRATFGKDKSEQLFNVALELTIYWINRILFLKLLEAQLVKYHKGDTFYAFLHPQFIPNYDELNKLFFQVLAKQSSDRRAEINVKFGKIPYLNSSLFEVNALEHKTIKISNLDNNELPLYSSTVLKDGTKPRYKSLPTLRYLLEFLDAYDFASESSADVQETAKTIINASVLGLIFEKLNGHKDGSVFTPGAVTMYMSREAIRATVVRKFNEAMGWNCPDYEALKNKDIDNYSKANAIVDSIRICDPAVGSGHFLVSVLNEIIRTKYDLGILLDCSGKRIKKQDWNIEIENDELVVSDSDGEPFVYIPGNDECQRVQETLFNEKRKIIENCLFGVDINRNAVNICRLRLWIELLKNAYYTKESGYSELETLPNIDINIKEGNSLVHRFDLKQDISEILNKNNISISQYKDAVTRYKNAHSKEEKRELEDMFSMIKSNLRTQISQNDPRVLRKLQLERELNNLITPKLFEIPKKERMIQAKQENALRSKIGKFNDEIEEIRNNTMFVGAFEWRIEFPELLDDAGNFVGFDCVIGNPPYIQLQKMGADADALQKMGYKTYERTGDIYCLFYECGYQLLKPNGHLCYITSNKWMRAGYGEKTREFFIRNTNPLLLIDFAGVKIFESATVDTSILLLAKAENAYKTLCAVTNRQSKDSVKNLSDYVQQEGSVCEFSNSDSWVILSPIEQSIKRKIEAVGTPLNDWDIQINYGIKTGYNDAFIINTEKRDEILSNCQTDDERTRTAELIRPILRGRDIKRYGYEWAGLHLIATFPSRHYDIEKYPAVKNYLLEFGIERLEQTGKSHIVNGEKIKARKKTNNKWFETQDSIGYWDLFFQPHICWKAVGRNLAFALVESGTFLTAPASFISAGRFNKTVLAFLCSTVGFYFVYKNSDTTGAGDIMLNIQSLIKFPIPKINVDFDKFSDTEIDQYIYYIYNFTQEEILYIEEQVCPTMDGG